MRNSTSPTTTAVEAPSPIAARGDQRSIAAPTISAPSGVVPIEPSVYRLIIRPPISAGECCWISVCEVVPYHTTAKPKYGIAARKTGAVGESATQASELPRQTAAMPAVLNVGRRTWRARRTPAAMAVTALMLSAAPNRLGWSNVRLESDAKKVGKLNASRPTNALASRTDRIGGERRAKLSAVDISVCLLA